MHQFVDTQDSVGRITNMSLLEFIAEHFDGSPYLEMDAQEQRAWFEMQMTQQGVTFVADLLATKEGRQEISRYLRTVEREEGVTHGATVETA